MSVTLEAVGQGAARQQSVSGVDAAVRRKVGVHVAFEVLVTLSDVSYSLSDALINYAQPRDLSSVECALVRPGLGSRRTNGTGCYRSDAAAEDLVDWHTARLRHRQSVPLPLHGRVPYVRL